MQRSLNHHAARFFAHRWTDNRNWRRPRTYSLLSLHACYIQSTLVSAHASACNGRQKGKSTLAIHTCPIGRAPQAAGLVLERALALLAGRVDVAEVPHVHVPRRHPDNNLRTRHVHRVDPGPENAWCRVRLIFSSGHSGQPAHGCWPKHKLLSNRVWGTSVLSPQGKTARP
jgi:hypothetical protein